MRMFGLGGFAIDKTFFQSPSSAQARVPVPHKRGEAGAVHVPKADHAPQLRQDH